MQASPLFGITGKSFVGILGSFLLEIVCPVNEIENDESHRKKKPRVFVDSSCANRLVVTDVEIVGIMISFLKQNLLYLCKMKKVTSLFRLLSLMIQYLV